MAVIVSASSEQLREKARASLERVQTFKIDELPREVQLGSAFNMKDAVPPAAAIVDLFNRLGITALDDFPDNFLNAVMSQSDAAYNLLKQAMDFTADIDNPKGVRQQIISSLKTTYTDYFTNLHPLIAYSLHRSADFSRLDSLARSTLQGIQDEVGKTRGEMKGYQEDAQRILETIRKVAAEEGVTQQAAHFRAEADAHDAKAETWRKTTGKWAWGVAAFAVVSLALHKIPFLHPESAYETVQLAISKILIFGVLGYMLSLAAKNFLSHRHNAIVNRHRQNALMTHRALVDGTGDSSARDAVMMQAASCIFSAQPTGYAPGAEGEGNSRSVVELMSKSAGAITKEAAR